MTDLARNLCSNDILRLVNKSLSLPPLPMLETSVVELDEDGLDESELDEDRLDEDDENPDEDEVEKLGELLQRC